MAEIVTPIVHLNGDRKQTLVAQLEHAYRAIKAALSALQDCAPNGRNYYPEPGRFERATAQHLARIAQLRAVMESLEAEVLQIEKETP